MGNYRNPKTQAELRTNEDPEHSPYTRGSRRRLQNSYDDVANATYQADMKRLRRWIGAQKKRYNSYIWPLSENGAKQRLRFARKQAKE